MDQLERDEERDDERSGRCAGRRLTGEQERFARLIAAGMTNAAVCRVEYAPVTPVIDKCSVRSDRYLSEVERALIADVRRDKLGVREIARQLGRDPLGTWS